MISRVSLFYALLLIFGAPDLQAGEIRTLFASDSSSAAYRVVPLDDGRLEFWVGGEEVQLGDQLELNTGETVIFNGVLGSGENTIVIQSTDGYALRLPMNLQQETLAVHTEYMKSYELLIRHIPSKFLANPSREQFRSGLVHQVELLNVSMTLDDYIKSKEAQRDSQIYRDLLDFLRAMTVFVYADDLYHFQIGYVEGRGWVLLDYGRSDKYAFYPSGSNISAAKYVIPHLFYFENTYDRKVVKWLEKDLKAIERKRSRLRQFIQSCKNLLEL